MSNQKEGNTNEGNGVAMNSQEDDEHYENGKDTPPRHSKRTKFREFDDYKDAAAPRDKRASRRSHRQKRGKDDVWPDTDD